MGIKKAIKKIIYHSMSNERMLEVLRKKRLANKVVILMYHEIADDHEHIEAWTVIKKSDFLRQMDYLRANFNVVSLEEAIAEKGNHGNDKPMAVLTFDDAYAGSRKTLLPLIESLKLPVTLFVPTGAVVDRSHYWYDRVITAVQTAEEIHLDLHNEGLGSYYLNRTTGAANWASIQKLIVDLKEMQPFERNTAVDTVLNALKRYRKSSHYGITHLTEEDIRSMSSSGLVTFGAHSHCHEILTHLKPADIYDSVMNSKKLLESWTGREVKYFAYPNGNYNGAVLKVMEESGFKCGLTTRNRPWDKEPIFEVPRIGVGRYDTMDLFKVRVSNALRPF